MGIKTINVNSLLQKHGQEIVDQLGKALPKSSDATRTLRQSIRFTVKPSGMAYNFQLILADYYEWVDKGRKAGKMPPVDEIVKWTAAKRSIFKQSKLPGRKGKLKQVSN